MELAFMSMENLLLIAGPTVRLGGTIPNRRVLFCAHLIFSTYLQPFYLAINLNNEERCREMEN
jgi:hypothetical protein